VASPGKRFVRASIAAVAVVAVALGAYLTTEHFRPSPAPYTPRDPALAGFPLLFYPSATPAAPVKGFVFFVGNDIGFWGAHQDLAKRLAGAGYHVVGFDVKAFFDRLTGTESERAQQFGDSVAVLARKSLAGSPCMPRRRS
jgi:hypothetical protein